MDNERTICWSTIDNHTVYDVISHIVPLALQWLHHAKEQKVCALLWNRQLILEIMLTTLLGTVKHVIRGHRLMVNLHFLGPSPRLIQKALKWVQNPMEICVGLCPWAVWTPSDNFVQVIFYRSLSLSRVCHCKHTITADTFYCTSVCPRMTRFTVACMHLEQSPVTSIIWP